jgi:hypothetical protein
MAEDRKPEIITFKVDAGLSEALRNLPNRSEFIRNALLTALEGTCPLCNGTGTLTAAQRQHWDAFMETHAVRRCGDCHAMHLVCEGATSAGDHA